jgi:hypothetical protein
MALFESIGHEKEQARYTKRLLFFALIVLCLIGLFFYNISRPVVHCQQHSDCGAIS